MKKAKIFTVVNQKGGTGKTTTSINLGAALALMGRTVLLVDFDPQAGLTTALGLQPAAGIEECLGLHDKKLGIKEATHRTEEGLDVVCAKIGLAKMELILRQRPNGERALKHLVDMIAGAYDYVIIDSPPTFGTLSINAMAAADQLIIPVQTNYLALEAASDLLDTINEIVEYGLNPDLEVNGFLGTMYQRNTQHGRGIMLELQDRYGGKVYKSIINQTVKFQAASIKGHSIFKEDKKSDAAKSYMDLAKEVEARV